MENQIKGRICELEIFGKKFSSFAYCKDGNLVILYPVKRKRGVPERFVLSLIEETIPLDKIKTKPGDPITVEASIMRRFSSENPLVQEEFEKRLALLKENDVL